MRPRRLLAARNILKALLLLGGIAAGLAALGWWIGGLRLASVFLVVALLIVGTLHWYGPRLLLASLGARELTLGEAAPLYGTAERLAAAAKVARPKLYVLPDGHPRALAVGRGASDVSLALSRGLAAVTTPAELEGVLAHELAHARHRDVTVQTPTVVLAMWLVETSRIGGFLERTLLFVLAPVAASLVHVLLSPKRELAADAAAAELCGTPHGLADALVRLEQAGELVEFRASPATEPLYTLNPFGSERLAAMFATHPPTGERVRRLRTLDPGWRERERDQPDPV
ncbi:MAG: M48 family metalloprotease [Thermoleophilia bacterium]|nr:M48 family metalloprotease [Thermoleophilia bacterium]